MRLRRPPRPSSVEGAGRGPRARVLAAALAACLTASGCVTTLGYVPEFVKPKEDQTNLKPTYREVKKWALDVADGYDTRHTLNRQMLYVGALVAAAGIGAMAGLAAFDGGSSAIIGIPIGTGFLAGVAGIYSSEEKSAIYGRASAHIKSLILRSDTRFQRHLDDAEMNTANELDAVQDAYNAGRRRREKAQDELARQQRLAIDARAGAEKDKADPTETEPNKAASEKSAQAMEKLVSAAKTAVMAAEVAVTAAEERYKEVSIRLKARQTLSKAAEALKDGTAPAAADVINALKAIEKERQAWEKRFEAAEAICLQQDVNDAMHKVAEHKAVLDPMNLAARLRAVGSPETKTGGEKPAPQIPPPDLSDLQVPAQSSCD